MFRAILFQTLSLLWPPRLFAGLGRLLTEWQRSGVREKGILLLVFAPMLICLLGLLFSAASFVLFVLPAFILRLLGWGVLTALFGAGGIYCHDKLKGQTSARSKDPSFYDVTKDSGPSDSVWEKASSSKGETPSWFENVRKMRWRK